MAPTAIPVSVSGRVTDPKGRAMKGIYITAYDQNTGSSSTVMTNSFGYYTVNSLLTTHAYVLGASSKRYTFSPDSMAFNLTDALTNANFVAFSR
jgi:hypothetical protein